MDFIHNRDSPKNKTQSNNHLKNHRVCAGSFLKTVGFLFYFLKIRTVGSFIAKTFETPEPKVLRLQFVFKTGTGDQEQKQIPAQHL